MRGPAIQGMAGCWGTASRSRTAPLADVLGRAEHPAADYAPVSRARGLNTVEKLARALEERRGQAQNPCSTGPAASSREPGAREPA